MFSVQKLLKHQLLNTLLNLLKHHNIKLSQLKILCS